MEPHFEGPYSQDVIDGVDALCAERYRDRKSKFKGKWFDKREGFEEWNKYCDFYLSETNRKRSRVNSANRSKQTYNSRHGMKALVAHRQDKLIERKGKYTSIDQYKDMHTYKNGSWTSEVAKN